MRPTPPGPAERVPPTKAAAPRRRRPVLAGLALIALGAAGATTVTGVAEDSPIRQLQLPSLSDADATVGRSVRHAANEIAGLRARATSDFERTDLRGSAHGLRRALLRQLPAPRARAVTVVLDRDGATLYPGPDHGRLGTSSLLLARGIQRMDIPPFAVDERRWGAIVGCVEARFEGFAVEVVERAPASGEFITVHFGGDPTIIGREDDTRGLAPLTGRPIPNAPVFVFTHGTPSVTELCDAAAHEVGHALGLDHSRLCTDLMSYGECGPKRFRDSHAACGEHEDRACEHGAPHQSSSELLERHVGRRPQRIT